MLDPDDFRSRTPPQDSQSGPTIEPPKVTSDKSQVREEYFVGILRTDKLASWGLVCWQLGFLYSGED